MTNTETGFVDNKAVSKIFLLLDDFWSHLANAQLQPNKTLLNAHSKKNHGY